MSGNPNYTETPEGYERRDDAPDARHISRIDWRRQQALEELRQRINDAREQQDRINEEYRRRRDEQA